MGNCSYCGKAAGLFSSEHNECRNTYNTALNDIPTLLERALLDNSAPEMILREINSLATSSFLKKTDRDKAVWKGFENLVKKALDDHIITQEEEDRIVALRQVFELTASDFSNGGLQEKFVQGALLRDLSEGKIQQRISIQGNLPIIIGPDERLLWLFQDVKYYETRTKTSYRGGSVGVSVRVVSGVYIRSGSYRGEPVKTTNLEQIDTGMLAITDKRLHFKGTTKGFRVDHKKLISVELYSDAIEIMKDGASPKPQVFGVNDPQFAANLLMRLTQL